MWREWPNVEVEPDSAAAVAEAAGADPRDPASCVYSGGRLYVQGVDQTALEAALSGYDPLPAARARALVEIDRRAEALLSEYVTDMLGIDSIYRAKAAEAAAHQAAVAAGQEPDPADYPWLAREAEACGRTLAQQVEIVAAAAALWASMGPEIEAIRQAAKQTVEAAADVAAIQTVIDGLTWPEAA